MLVASPAMRCNPTTVLITFLTASNLVFTSLVLPQTAVSMLNVGYVTLLNTMLMTFLTKFMTQILP